MTTLPTSRVRLAAIAALIGFLAGAVAMAALVWTAGSGATRHAGADTGVTDDVKDSGAPATRTVYTRPAREETPPAVTPPPPPAPADPPSIASDPIADLRRRTLELPLEGATRSELRGSFDELRGKSRRHEAIDMLAPRNTPIRAVDDGTIARLFTSAAGGLTVYQFDPTTNYVYYYAHLERYAPGLEEGERVRRGQLLGFVGTSGNAPKDTPHLHFAIFKLTDRKRWWEGSPIDPYQVFK